MIKKEKQDWTLLYNNKIKSPLSEDDLEGDIPLNGAKSIFDRARTLRNNQTEAESILWNFLRKRNLNLKFRRQHVIGDYIVDFVNLKSGTIIEIDGGYHNEIEQKEYDENRTQVLLQKGYTVLRFSNNQVIKEPDSIIKKILSHIKSKDNSKSCNL